MFRRDKNVVRERRTKDGKIVWFYREGHGKRTRLPGLPGSPEFNAAVAVAKGYASSVSPTAVTKALAYHDPHSLAWLIDQYMSSAVWAGTAEATQKVRRNILKHVLAKSGAMPFRSLTQRDIEATHAEIVKTGKTAQANAFVKVMRVFCAWAQKRQFLASNIARDVELVARKSEGFHTWTEDEIARFVDCYPLGTREYLAFAVLLYTGQRRSDCLKFGRHSIMLNGRLKTFLTTKTGTPVSIPVLPQLKAALEAGPIGETWIVGDKGAALSKDAFTTWFRGVCDRAGLAECSAHGLRKACARRFAEAGASVDELKAWFGWSENRTPGIYTRDANNSQLADNAARRLAA